MTKQKDSIEARLIRSMKEAVSIAKGQTKASREYDLPLLTAKDATVPAAPAYNSTDVIAIRTKLKLSQALFAQALNVSAGTVRSWEQGEKPPQGPSRRLLEIAARSPQTILRTVVVERPRAPKGVISDLGHEHRSGTDRRVRGDRRARRHPTRKR